MQGRKSTLTWLCKADRCTCLKDACCGNADVEVDVSAYYERDVLMPSEKVTVEDMQRSLGRPKMYWRNVIRQDMTQLHITKEMTLDRK
ncbi:hypothetical protein H5410_004308 [Solanum commersonii]|uniref:Uncharacterized protein n=1 Tax=Solanum commersonii TaxID=4109 RepID=A0A9J6B842_SOLCO|nr:hypothetical protein H5410_004308 [Solanum commersonii]